LWRSKPKTLRCSTGVSGARELAASGQFHSVAHELRINVKTLRRRERPIDGYVTNE
jgi:hypothetical protein